MSTIITFAVIGLFLWFVVPTLFSGKSKKVAKQRFWCRLAGAILVLLAVLALINHII